MPTYDYICIECSHEFEEFQKMSDPVIETCPKCNGPVKRKIGGGAGLLFKGNGFYITDYKKSGASADSKEKTEKKETSDNNKKSKKADKS